MAIHGLQEAGVLAQADEHCALQLSIPPTIPYGVPRRSMTLSPWWFLEQLQALPRLPCLYSAGSSVAYVYTPFPVLVYKPEDELA